MFGETQHGAPVVQVQAAFDEERALVEIREQIDRRDAAKGAHISAMLVIGQKLIEARRAMPGVALQNGKETYSAAFLAFCAKVGLGKETVTRYMSLARSPARLERSVTTSREARKSLRATTLIEIRDALLACTREEVLEAIEQELKGAANGNAEGTGPAHEGTTRA